MAVSKRLRFEILRRDNHACRYCGATAPDVALTVDHVIPTALGGSDEPTNLVTACAPCNSGKSSSSPDAPIVDDVAADAMRWGRAMERASQIRQQQRARELDDIAWFETIWTKYWVGGQACPVAERQYAPREPNWEAKVTRLLAAGLDVPFLAHAVQAAMLNERVALENVWRYFCGVCWREVDRRQEIAAQLIAADEAER